MKKTTRTPRRTSAPKTSSDRLEARCRRIQAENTAAVYRLALERYADLRWARWDAAVGAL